MRKISGLVICVFLVCPNAFSQAASAWDSTYRPAIYSTRAGQFRSFSNSPEDIIFLGNSITAYANWNELLENEDARNRGIPGDITFGVISRLDEVVEGKPEKIFILIGINDIARNIPDSIILLNYKRIIQRIKLSSPNTRIYFHTLLPVNNTFVPSLQHFNKEEHIVYINQELKKLAIDEKIELIDLYSAFADTEKRLDKSYTFDGLHLNDKGYLKWAELLKKGRYLTK